MPELPKSIKRPSDLFRKRRGVLARVLQHSRSLLAMQDRVRALLPGNRPGDVYVASMEADVLHLVVPSAALATRIKYSQKTILAGLRADKSAKHLKSIKISVRPIMPERPAVTRPALPPNSDNARQIEATAKYIEDEPLRKALMRLANRAKSTD